MYQPNNVGFQTGAQTPMNGNYGYYPNEQPLYLDRRQPNNFQPSYQPVQQPMPYNQPQQPPVQGHWVASPAEITPREVPMDGSVAFFPTKDYSKIYAKAWDQNGTIKTVEYVPIAEEPATSPDIPALDKLQQKLESIEKMVRNLNSQLGGSDNE